MEITYEPVFLFQIVVITIHSVVFFFVAAPCFVTNLELIGQHFHLLLSSLFVDVLIYAELFDHCLRLLEVERDLENPALLLLPGILEVLVELVDIALRDVCVSMAARSYRQRLLWECLFRKLYNTRNLRLGVDSELLILRVVINLDYMTVFSWVCPLASVVWNS